MILKGMKWRFIYMKMTPKKVILDNLVDKLESYMVIKKLMGE